MMLNLSIQTDGDEGGRTVETDGPLLLTDAAARAGLPLNTRCGCRGVCAGCAVRLEQGEFEVNGERVVADPAQPREVLACQARAISPTAKIHVPAGSRLEQTSQIAVDFVLTKQPVFNPVVRRIAIEIPAPKLEAPRDDLKRLATALAPQYPLAEAPPTPALLNAMATALAGADGRVVVTLAFNGTAWELIDIHSGERITPVFGLAIDIGTTTVAMALVDLRDGVIVGRVSDYNQQVQCADDVAARISFADTPAKLDKLRRLVVDGTINPLVVRLCRMFGMQPTDIMHVAIAGNTVMAHLLYGLSPASIGRLPFQPVTNRYPDCPAAELGIEVHPAALVQHAPSSAGYIGGDVVCDIHVADLERRSAPTLLVDIGTNGEIVLAAGGQLLACATAAGPAFEGGGIRNGMRAADGAIEHMVFGPDLVFDISVINGSRPVGLCGSAIIDFIAEGMRCGLINAMGRFNRPMLEAAGRYSRREATAGPIHACIIVEAAKSGTGKEIYVSEYDVSQILKAKAAIYAGMKTLMQCAQLRFADLDRLVLAGGFSRHTWLRNAVTLGLLPEIEFERIEVISNGSLAGAYLMLTDGSTAPELDRVAKVPHVIELNLDARFEGNYIDGLALPNLCGEDFPATMQDLQNQSIGSTQS